MGTRVIPTLVYVDIETEHDFLVRAFGFESGGVQRASGGLVVNGEVRMGEEVIWLHRETSEHKLVSPASIETANSGLVVYDDLDAHFNQARPIVV